MPISKSVPRSPVHTRTIRFQGYLREDGLWDMEAELLDRREYVYRTRDSADAPAGNKVHHMLMRVTLDERLVIRAIETNLSVTPFDECGLTAQPVDKLVGVRIGSGWRRAINDAMGGVRGCTHLRELLINLGTAVFQTIPVYLSHQRRARGEPLTRMDRPPRHLGQCMSLDFDGPVVARIAPQFAGWKEPAAR